MKTAFIILCTIFLAGSTVEAQIIRSIGLTAGYVYAQQDWKYAPQTGITDAGIEPISAFSGGVFVEFFDIDHFSLFTKLLYAGKGRIITVMATKIDPASPSGYVDTGEMKIKDRLQYLSIPMLIKLRIETPGATPFIAVGPRFEYLMLYTSSIGYDKFKSIEWTGTISAGSEFSFDGLPMFIVEATYNSSLTDSYKTDLLTVSDSSIEILLGISF